MNDDDVPDSVDDVLAKAARMGRTPPGVNAIRPPDETALQLSLAAVASHARSEAAAAAEKNEREAQKAVVPAVDPIPAVRQSPAAVPQAETRSMWARPVDAASRDDSVPVDKARDAFAEPFTLPSEEIAAWRKPFVRPDTAPAPAAVGATPEALTPETPVSLAPATAAPDEDAPATAAPDEDALPLAAELPPSAAAPAVRAEELPPWVVAPVVRVEEPQPVTVELPIADIVMDDVQALETAPVVITAVGLPADHAAAMEPIEAAAPVAENTLQEVAAPADTADTADTAETAVGHEQVVSSASVASAESPAAVPLALGAAASEAADAQPVHQAGPDETVGPEPLPPQAVQLPAVPSHAVPFEPPWVPLDTWGEPTAASAPSAPSGSPSRLTRRGRPLLATAAVLVLCVIAGVAVQRNTGVNGQSAQPARNDAPRVAMAPPGPAATPRSQQPAPPAAVAMTAATTTPAAASAAPSAAVLATQAPVAVAAGSTGPAASASAVAPPVVAGATPAQADARPLLGLVTEQADVGNTALAEQLLAGWRASGPASADDVQASGWSAGLAALAKGPPRVAVVRYDALQAARRALVPGTAASGSAAQRLAALEVVAPLTLEPVYLVVRADSPLQFVHEIRGKAINAGAAQSSRALTVDTLYRGLFNAPLPAHPLRAQDEAAALEQLAAGKLDVVALVGTASRPGLGDAASSNGKQFKLLAFDPDQPVARNALNSFLPVQAAARSLGSFPATGTPILGMMSFVVTSRQPGPSTSPGTGAGADTKGTVDPHARAIARLADELCGVRSGRSSGVQRVLLKGQQRVDPALQLDVGWPYSAAARDVLSRCGAAGAVPRAAATPPGSS